MYLGLNFEDILTNFMLFSEGIWIFEKYLFWHLNIFDKLLFFLTIVCYKSIN